MQREGGALRAGFVLDGDLAQLKIPPRQQHSRRGENLWQHTCFEIFIARHGMPGYYEYNFSPSGEWAAYSFASYRAGGPLADDSLAPQLKINRSGDRLELDCLIGLDPLSLGGARLSIGLSAVIEDAQGSLSFWALHHPAQKPDFHHRDSFSLDLEASPR